MHRGVIKYLLKYCEDNPQYVNQFKFTACGDELFFSTILIEQVKALSIEQRNSLRYIDWKPKREYTGRLPLLLNEQDVDYILQSGAFFCRKVDSSESEILLQVIDKLIFGITE